jgi:hypothetical protein
MAIDHTRALVTLRSHPATWVRPETNAQLLSYLFLALKGIAIAARDSEGYIFRIADSSAAWGTGMAVVRTTGSSGLCPAGRKNLAHASG